VNNLTTYFTIDLQDNEILVAIPCEAIIFTPWYNGRRFEIDRQFRDICHLLELIPKYVRKNPLNPSEDLLDIKLMTWYNPESNKWEQDIFTIIAIKAEVDETENRDRPISIQPETVD
jgi:hypothetical protein